MSNHYCGVQVACFNNFSYLNFLDINNILVLAQTKLIRVKIYLYLKTRDNLKEINYGIFV